MKSEQLKQIISNHPHLMKITPSTFSKVFKNLTGEDLDYTKTYGEQGFDDLDLVEMVMHLEKEFNIHIHDEVIYIIFNIDMYPVNFTYWYRQERLSDLGI